MKIKIIKREAKAEPLKKASEINPNQVSPRNKDRKVRKNILSWVSELRDKKNLEFIYLSQKLV